MQRENGMLTFNAIKGQLRHFNERRLTMLIICKGVYDRSRSNSFQINISNLKKKLKNIKMCVVHQYVINICFCQFRVCNVRAR